MTTSNATMPAKPFDFSDAREVLLDTRAREEWRRANEAGEGFAGDDAVDEIVSTLLGHGSDRVLLVVQAGRTLACAYSYGASWCVDVTESLLDA